MSFFFKDLMN